MMERPKILLTNFHRGTGGGHRTFILDLLKSPLARQFDFALACPPTSSINSLAREMGVLVFDQNFPGALAELFQVIKSVRNLEHIHRQFPFDIIHCNGSRDHWVAIYWKTIHRRSAKIIRSRHAVKEIHHDMVHDWAFNRMTDLNIFVSRGMVPLCQPPGRLQLRKLKVITYGIDTEHFKPRERDGKLAAQAGIDDRDFVVGSNAGLGTHKRADLMLRAVAGIPDPGRIKIVLLGETRSTGNYLAQARHLGLEKNVICAGMLDDVRPYLSLFDLGFVLSDSIETSSLAAKEMMAMGIPLICTRFSGLPENVDEGKNGFLIEPGSLEDLQKCLTIFLGMTDARRREFRDHSRDKVLRDFPRQRYFDSYAQVYREVSGG